MQNQQRRMTSHNVGRSLSSLNLSLPEGAQPQFVRPPSPLRNGFVPDSSTGIDPDVSEDGSDDEDDNRDWHHRSPSPTSSMSQLAANLAQRVGTFVGGITQKSPGGAMSDAELEAEAERERDRSRHEAEAILTREAHERKLVEERVLAMMESTKALPPPPSRSQTLSNPPSPTNSQKEKEGSSWWTAAKNRLAQVKEKEPLTPAQQVIQEAKARDKEKKNGKSKEKGSRDNEWPANPNVKYADPAFANLNIPVTPPHRKPVPQSPVSPTPSRPSISNMAPNLTPSPMRMSDAASPSSPSREAPPLYAQFNTQGTLDVHGTLLAIAKRFEKLEKWTVGHVRALEERMSDVERWLVEKEKEKEKEDLKKESSAEGGSEKVDQEIREMREEMSELQGRMGELGREMAKMATAPSNLSSGPKSRTVSLATAPQTTSSILEQGYTATSPIATSSSIQGSPQHKRLSSTTAVESTSPPLGSMKRNTSGTRLPYPTGDYTAPPDSFSPTNSPPGSINSTIARTRPLSIPSHPSAGPASSASLSYSSASFSSASSMSSSIGRTTSPLSVAALRTTKRTTSPKEEPLSPPRPIVPRESSVSPTPRKRYTVALGGPIIAPDNSSTDNSIEPLRRTGTPVSLSRPYTPIERTQTPLGSSSRASVSLDEDETIGKRASGRLGKNLSTTSTPNSYGSREVGDYKSSSSTAVSPSAADSPASNRRIRAQSTYAGFANLQLPQTPVTPLKPKARSKSTDRFMLSGETSMTTATGAKFVDPLVLRKQEKEGVKIAMPKPVGKVPIGQLVAFFDGEKKG